MWQNFKHSLPSWGRSDLLGFYHCVFTFHLLLVTVTVITWLRLAWTTEDGSCSLLLMFISSTYFLYNNLQCSVLICEDISVWVVDYGGVWETVWRLQSHVQERSSKCDRGQCEAAFWSPMQTYTKERKYKSDTTNPKILHTGQQHFKNKYKILTQRYIKLKYNDLFQPPIWIWFCPTSSTYAVVGVKGYYCTRSHKHSVGMMTRRRGIYLHNTHTSSPYRDSNPRYQKSSGRRLTP